MTVLRVRGPRSLRGQLRVPGDKSISHRALLFGALADGTSTVRGISDGEDVGRTRAILEAMGVVMVDDGAALHVTGGALEEADTVLDVGNSGTAIRLLAGFCAAQPFLSVLAGDESIARRPMDRVAAPLRSMGAHIDGRQGGRFTPLVIRGGNLHGIDFTSPVPSAQVKSAVLLAGLGAHGETVVREAAPTRAHTEEMLELCGAHLEVSEGVIRLRPSVLKPFDLDVAGDPSQAAFWIVGACVAPDSELSVDRVYLGPARRGFLDVLLRMGADVQVDEGGNLTARTSQLRGTEVTAAEVPGLIDEVPVLAVAAASAVGTTVVHGVGELRVKETDRVATIISELGSMGALVEAHGDNLVITGSGPGSLRAAEVRSHGDHRIAMAVAVAALAATGVTVIDGWEAVATSYPGFEGDLASCAS